jgi:glucose-6-phosphate isomerase/transaldolase/glucose-6-phosphate isomerase
MTATGEIAHLLDHESNRAVVEKIWQRDPDLWKQGDAAHAKVITNRLGWLDVIDVMRPELPRLHSLGERARDIGIADLVLLGMGGSSLCPEVLRASFGPISGFPTLHVLDTTDPAAITKIADEIDPQKTWFIVSSKSGTTLETLSHFAYFWNVVTRSGSEDPGSHFIAVTDPGSNLAELAQRHAFRTVFENPPDIGGRYSALSFFGLVPAALAGINVGKLLDRADEMRTSCHPDNSLETNGGLLLGTTMAHYRAKGIDKVTILAPPEIAAFSLWAEQLIAESTGKEGKGIIPIGDEPIGAPDVYGGDRLFVALSLGEHEHLDQEVAALAQADNPVLKLRLRDLYDLGAEFFRWEFATAFAAVSLQIDPFDEPNVKESKDNTNAVLQQFESQGKLPAEPAGGLEDLRALLQKVNPGDYVATMAYIEPTDDNHEALQAFRVAIRDQLLVATTVGFGPRFLHSTGQLHKGGPNTGVFIQFTQVDPVDADIPNKPFTFSILKHAQSVGDLQSLEHHGRRVVHIDLGDDPAGQLALLTDGIQAVSAKS